MKYYYFTLMLCLSIVSAEACIKQETTVNSDTIRCFITDSTSALIPNAIAKVAGQKSSYKSSFDGQVMLVLAAHESKVYIEAEGYKSRSVTIQRNAHTSEPVFITLERNKEKNPVNHPMHRYAGKTGMGTVMYAKPMIMESAVAEVESAIATDATIDKFYDCAAHTSAAMLPAEAGRLTAGEVNDFARWDMWDSILLGSHQQYVSAWQMRANERYVVQVISEDGYPLANRTVSLRDEKNTIYQARTDNTGRAELWNGLCEQPSTSPLYVDVEGVRLQATPFSESIIQVRLNEKYVAPQTADVFFIMDATGSMGDELRYLQAEVNDVITRSENAIPGLTIRTGALVYRDHGDEYLTRIARLDEDIHTTQAFLNKQQANGGGDYEEAIPEALMAAFNAAGWDDEARTRIAFLIFDAPCHQDSATIALLHEQVLNAAAMGIRLVPVVCSGLREAGELLARTLALATNGTSFFLTDDSAIGESHLKPTTDSLKVEKLNDMLVRTIIEFCRMPEQKEEWIQDALTEDNLDFYLPNPTDAPSAHESNDWLRVSPNPCSDICHIDLGEAVDALCLIDATGKTLRNLGATAPGRTSVSVRSFATGVYFVKAYREGRWHTAKLIIVNG